MQTDQLKPEHELRIGNSTLTMRWLIDTDAPQPVPIINQQLPNCDILGVLNDDCLREIFVNLPELDRCAVAHVCQRFRDVVLQLRPKQIEITNHFVYPLWKAEIFFRIFGKSIQTAHITDSCPCPDIVLSFLWKYCDNIVEVDCRKTLKRPTMNEAAALFPRLRRVQLNHYGTADIVFQPNHRIESISVGVVHRFPPIRFPNLRELQFHIMELDMPSSEPFFAFNSQIEQLMIYGGNLVPHLVPVILAKLP